MSRSPPIHFLTLLRRIILALVKFRPTPQIFRAILRKLAYLWSIIHPKILNCLHWTHKTTPKPSGHPTTTVIKKSKPTDKPQAPDANTKPLEPQELPNLPVNTISTGEIIPLDGTIAASSYPFGRGLHSNVSSQNLAATHVAHLQEVRRRSNISLVIGPSRQSGSSSVSEDYNINIRSPTLGSPTSPIPHRQFSMSTPALGSSATGYPPPSNPIDIGLPFRTTSPEPALPPPSIHSRRRLGFDVDSIHSDTTDDPVSIEDHARSSSPDQLLPPPSISSRARSHIETRLSSPLPVALASETIFPVVPENFTRYFTRGVIPPEYLDCTIPTLTTDFMKNTKVPEGWKFVIHPEGQPYFYHERHRAYTDANLFDRTLLKRINKDLHTIESFIHRHSLRSQMPKKYDLALELWMKEDECMTNYYFANHDNRSIFFLDSYDATTIATVNPMRGLQELRHVQFELIAQYWYHVQTYPTCVSLTELDLCELRDEVMHNIGDLMTSPYSTSPYALDDLHKILSLLTPLSKNIGTPSPGSLTLVARFKTVFARQKLMNWHGLPCARLERHVSVYGNKHKTTWLLKSLSPVLFSAPDVIDRLLQKIWTDETLHQCVYNETIKKLNDEWQELILFATVLLNANVAFLSIDSVDSGEGNSVAQIASYISTLMSAGSIILGLLLVRQTRTKNRETATDVQTFLSKRSHPTLGLETIAILFSLPYALLMWSVVFFLGAFAVMVLSDGGPATRGLFSSCGCAVLLFTVWCIATGWEEQPPPDEQLPLPYIASELGASGGANGASTSSMKRLQGPPLTSNGSDRVRTPLERIYAAVGLQRRPSGGHWNASEWKRKLWPLKGHSTPAANGIGGGQSAASIALGDV